jgi:MerR family transcriptional regulator, light-induced transcriptional regulator
VERDGPLAPGNAQTNPRPDSRRARNTHQQADLNALVRDRVRAFVTHHGLSTIVGRPVEQASLLPPCCGETIAHLAQLALSDNGPALRKALQVYVEAGWPKSVILLDLLTPVVRLIGVYWEEDRYNFAAVTVASNLIQRLVHELDCGERRVIGANAPRALVAATPGDQHSFGVVVVAEMLRAAGWSVVTRLDSNLVDLCADVANDDYRLIALSLSRSSCLDNMRDTITAMRRENRAGGVCFMVGGRVFTSGEADARQVGADIVAVDASDVIRLMEEYQLS